MARPAIFAERSSFDTPCPTCANRALRARLVPGTVQVAWNGTILPYRDEIDLQGGWQRLAVIAAVLPALCLLRARSLRQGPLLRLRRASRSAIRPLPLLAASRSIGSGIHRSTGSRRPGRNLHRSECRPCLVHRCLDIWFEPTPRIHQRAPARSSARAPAKKSESRATCWHAWNFCSRKMLTVDVSIDPLSSCCARRWRR